MKNIWTIPKVKTYPPESKKEWYVWFRFNKGNPIRIKDGINKIKDYNRRLEYITDLAEVLRQRLEMGWVPECAMHYKPKDAKIGVIEAIQYGFAQKQLTISKNTEQNLQSTVNAFIWAVKKLKLDTLYVSNFERHHAKAVLEHLKKSRNWTNKNYNKQLGYLRSIFYEVLEAEYIKTNPFNEIRNLKVVKTLANVPPTDEEMREICRVLKEENYGFYIFFMVIYYCGIRPEELRNLKIKHLDFENRNFKLDAEFTKTDRDRIVPMLGNIHDLLSPYRECNPDYYVFGTWLTNGGKHSRKNWFMPNPYQIKEDTPNKQWRQLIKKGLGIEKNLYSAKHKGADDKRRAGMDIKTICAIFGHSEEKMTERYMHSLKEERMEQARKIQLKEF